MSEVKAEVTFTTRIDKCTDRGSSRYAMDTVVLVPVPDDDTTVYAAACDSRCAVVVPCEGRADAVYQVPPEVQPHKRHKGGLKTTLNGRWETSEGKFCETGEERRFPDLCGVMPDAEDMRVVTLDVRLLANMADAMGVDRLSLLIAPESETKDQTQCVRTAVVAIPVMDNHTESLADGFGIVMPIHGDHAATVRAYLNRRKAFSDAASKAGAFKR